MSRKLVFLITSLLMATNAFICLAQVEQGAITGVVVDPTGALVPSAKVTATNVATGVVARAETTGDGYYKIPYLPAGKYTVAVEKEGFATNRVTEVPVLVGQSATINVTLKPGSIHDEVTVTSNGVLIEQVSSSLGYVAGSVQVLELPTNRSPYSLAVLSPGVINTGNGGTGPIVNGGRPTRPPFCSMDRTPGTTRLSTMPTPLPRRRCRKCGSSPTVSRLNTVVRMAASWSRPAKAAATWYTAAFTTT
jgi:hypothetical protein